MSNYQTMRESLADAGLSLICLPAVVKSVAVIHNPYEKPDAEIYGWLEDRSILDPSAATALFVGCTLPWLYRNV